jgi:hypothetical protein
MASSYLFINEEIVFGFFLSLLGYFFIRLFLLMYPITIKSTQKLELIETITTPTDTIYKYEIIKK